MTAEGLGGYTFWETVRIKERLHRQGINIRYTLNISLAGMCLSVSVCECLCLCVSVCLIYGKAFGQSDRCHTSQHRTVSEKQYKQ